ncbi:MAG: hypothetical protein V3U96_12335 [Paracoccaceae bacterium]
MTYDETGQVLTISDGTQTIPIPVDLTEKQIAGFLTHYNFTGDAPANDDNFAYVATTDAGGFVVAISNGQSDMGLAYTYYQGGETPTSGTSGTFNGNYAATYILSTDAGGSSQTISGDAQLIVDFSAGTITGSITNREADISLLLNPAVADVTFTPTGISDFGFSGTTTGGEITGGTTTTAGTYSGIFDGAGAEQVIGGIAIVHDVGGVTYYEAGAFIATQ